jgi:hypothetical protein
MKMLHKIIHQKLTMRLQSFEVGYISAQYFCKLLLIQSKLNEFDIFLCIEIYKKILL